MHTEHHIRNVQRLVNDWKRQGHSVGFVPTMGNLHAGHLALVKRAAQLADKVVVSIFVNPIQFAPSEDFDSYPRTQEQDAMALAEAGVDLLFAPSVSEMYPAGVEQQTRVCVGHIGDILEGASRPGFFTGVATVVNKLFHIVPADLAVFGAKDYQQLQVIRRMVDDLSMNIDIIDAPIVRETDGLAMSSRNGYLGQAERQAAPQLYRLLCEARERILAGDTDFRAIENAMTDKLNDCGYRTDYVSIRRTVSLEPAQAGDTSLVVLVAAWLGNTRLIDNIAVEIQ
ncbi:MAG: pantoate--beta-alanine ligase [Gammaproteobacteria bacterium]|nr:pantoate--beta-alanine ligase [Gammaproteobacteria bacterium]